MARNTLFDVDDEQDRATRMGTNLMGNRQQTVAPRFTDQMRFGTTNVGQNRETDLNQIESEN